MVTGNDAAFDDLKELRDVSLEQVDLSLRSNLSTAGNHNPRAISSNRQEIRWIRWSGSLPEDVLSTGFGRQAF